MEPEHLAPPQNATPVDRHVWMACAVPLSRLLEVGALVYYFPEGHCEQCSNPPTLPSPLPILCSVASVRLFADRDSDEVFAYVSLVPRNDAAEVEKSPLPADGTDGGNSDEGVGVKYFAKQLTPSDANNGGGFSVPRYCADNIFPSLDLEADPPVQTLSLSDLHGRRWDFRHIYRGTPRRHLLTTGWSRFVNFKKLVARDTVVFMRRSEDGELLVGVRRTPRYAAVGGRDVRARVPAAAVAEAARLAAEGKPFEVAFYPRQSAGEFLIPQEEVDAAMRVVWETGVQVRMQVMEAEDSRRVEWASGNVKALSSSGSLWRILEINWDESTSSSLNKWRFVSPWQVQIVERLPLLKKPRSSETTAPLDCGVRTMTALLTQPDMEILLPSSIPAGMQGARHDCHTDLPCSSTSINTNDQLYTRSILDCQVPLKLSGSSEAVSSQTESPPNNSVNSYRFDLPDERKSIQLFGRTITTSEKATPNGASEEVKEVTNGVVDGNVEQDTSAMWLLDWPPGGDDGHSQNDPRQGV